jgi:hypothetical protein
VTGKKVQLPWGKATVEEEATIPASAGERPIELGVARLSGSDGEAVADVDHARILTRARQHAPSVHGQAPQLQARVLVAAMLRPQEREDGELEVVGRPLERLLDLRVLGVRQPEGTMERLLGRLCHASS